MSDFYERSRQIRRGELDDKLPDYSEITGWIQRVPRTWLPGILRQAVRSCLVNEVFNEGKLAEMVARFEKEAKDPTSILRDGI